MDIGALSFFIPVAAAAPEVAEAGTSFGNATFVFAVLAAIIFVIASTKFISQGYAGLIERMGKYTKTIGPGVHFILPIFSRVRRVNLKEQNDHYEPQNAITKDHMQVRVDAIIFFRIVDPKKAMYDVDNYNTQVETLTVATMRNIIGSMTLSSCLQSREEIDARLREVLDEHTARYGVKVTGVEINAIDPPRDFREAMEQEKRAEIERNAAVVRSEGQKIAAMNRAEGEKNATIALAEGEREALRTRAEGERDAARLRAEGKAQAYTSLFRSIREAGIDKNVLSIRYLEALEKVANGKATTLILPSDSTSLLGAVAQIAQTLNTVQTDSAQLEAPSKTDVSKPTDKAPPKAIKVKEPDTPPA